MWMKPPAFRRSLLGLLFLSLSAAPAAAVQHEVQILMDQDDDPGTGCLVNTVEGPLDGIEQILVTTVDTSSPPEAGMVTDVATRDCVDEVTDTFSAPASFDGGWPVGIGNGVGGRDVVETYLPLVASVVPDPAVIRLGVVVTDELGGEQALLTTDGSPGGEPIRIFFGAILDPAEIPTVGEWGLILLALVLAVGSLWLLGRRGTVAVGVVIVLLAAGGAWAAVNLDGLIGEWSPGDQLGSNGIVLFGMEEGANVCFRVDVDLLFNQPPVAEPDAFATDEDTLLAGENVLADNGSGADSDPNADPLTVTGFDPVSTQGAAVTVVGNGDLTYDPTGAAALQALDDGDSVMDTFTYTIEDPSGGSDTATVTVSVDGANDAPTAMDDTYETDEDVPLAIPAPGVLVNDGDVDTGDSIIAVLDTDVSDGTLTLLPDGSFTYTPDPDFNGVDSFTYHATDGTADSPTVTATITVGAVNDGPNAVDDLFMTGEDAVLNEPAPGVLTNDTDPEMDALTVTTADTVSAQGAAVTVNADGSFDYDPTGAPALQALDDGEVLDDTFTYTVDDGSGNPDTATVTVTVTGANDAPVAVDDAYATDEDVALNVPAPGVLGNDTDVDVEALTAVLVAGPSNAAAFMLNANGSFSYTPAANFNGSDSFTYRANDGTASSNLATVTLTVTPVNDPPVADDEMVIVACNLEHVVENAPGETAAATGSIFRTVADNVLVGDSDPVEMSAVAIVEASGLPGGTTDSTGPDFTITTDQGGSLTLHADGSFVYTPEGGDRNLMDTFTYTLQDAEGAQDTATVTLDVANVCVWFVDNSTGADDTGTGSSSDPFTSLVDELGPDALADDAEDASQPGDVIYVFEGDSRTGDPYDGNFAAETNERILGQGVDLVVDLGAGPETLFTGNPANRPMVEGVSAGVAVSVIDVTGVEVAGLEMTGGDNSFTATSITAPMGFDLHDNVMAGASTGAIVIDQNGAFDSIATLTGNQVTSSTGNAIQVEVGAGSLELALEENTGLTSTGSGIELDGGGGSLYVTSFCGNIVSGDTGGTGIRMMDVIFDADPANPGFAGDEVSCGTGTTIGSSGNRVGGFGMILDGVRGDLDLGQLDVFAGEPGGGDETALEVFATGTFNAGMSMGFQLTTSGGTVSSLDGPAIVIDPTDLEAMVLDTVVSQGSAGAGIHLSQVTGSFQVTGTTDVDAAAGVGIEILSSPVVATFGTTDVDNTTGVGVRYMSGTTGTLTFSGPLTIDTTSGGGLVADSGGTVAVLDNTSTVATTTGTGVSVTNSTIGAGGMTLASVSVSGAANGIVLTNAGAGAFSAAGGSLQNVTSRGLDVDQGTGSVTYGGGISTTASGRSVEVTNHGGGSAVSLGGAIDDNGLGIFLDNNDVAGGSTITFSGGLDLDTGSSAAFTATNGGTVNVLSDAVSTTADTTTGTVVNIANTAIGGSGVFFDSVGSTGGANGILLTNAGGGAFTAGGGTIANKTARGVDVAGGSGNVTVSASVSTTASGRSVEVTGHGGGTVDFNGAIDDDGLGIHLDANTGSVLRFDGQLDLDTGANTAFNATNGGTVVVTAFGNDVDTTAGIGVNIVDTTIGAADVEFQSVSVNGALHGIVLDSTGTSGTFTVAGDGSSTGGVTDRDGSGGTLVTASDAVLLDQATGVSLRQMNIPGAGADGLHSTGGGNIFLEAIAITDPAGDGWEATDLTGTNRIFSDSLISGIDNAGTSGVVVSNTSVDLTSLTLDGSTFTNSTGGQGMVVMRGLGTSNMTLVISDGNTADPADSVFSNLNQSAVVISAGTDVASTSTITTNISDTEFRDGPVGGFNNVEIQALENGTANFDVSNNLFSNLDPPGANSGIVLLQATGNGTLGATSGANGSVSGNTFTGIDGRRGIHLTSNNNASNHNVIVANNTFQDLEREALFVSARDSTAGFDLRVTGNTFGTSANPVGNTDREAVEITAENSAVLNAELRNNDLVNSSGTGFSQALRVVSLDNAVLNVSIRRSNPADPGTQNTFRTIGTNTAFTAETLLGGTSTMCLELSGNDALSSAGASGGGTYALTETTGTFNVVDRDNTNANNAGTVTFTPAIGSFGDVGSCPAPSL